MAHRWAIESADDLLLEDVDEFLCCYSTTTGRTHILDAFPAELMRLLVAGPHTARELAAAIAAQVGEEDIAPWLASVDPVLSELECLRLVACDDPDRGGQARR